MTEPLKPCPFCGAEAGFDGGWVFCHQCGVGYGDRDNAVLRKLWNRRWYAAGSRFGKTASRTVNVDAILKVAERLDHIRDLYGALVPFDPAVSGFDSALERPGQRTSVILMMNFVLSGEVQSALRKACGAE